MPEFNLPDNVNAQFFGIKQFDHGGIDLTKTLVQSKYNNSLYPRIVRYVHGVSPSTELGAGIALLDERQGVILANIDNSKLRALKVVNDIVSNWHKASVYGSDSYSIGSLKLGVTRALLSAFEIGQDDYPGLLAITKYLVGRAAEADTIDVEYKPLMRECITRAIEEHFKNVIGFKTSSILENESEALVNVLLTAGYKMGGANGKVLLTSEGRKSGLVNEAGIINEHIVNDNLIQFFISIIVNNIDAMSMNTKGVSAGGKEVGMSVEYTDLYAKINSLLSEHKQGEFDWNASLTDANIGRVIVKALINDPLFQNIITKSGSRFYTDVTALLTEANRMLSRNSGTSLTNASATVSALIEFQDIVTSFYETRVQGIKDSFSKTDDLMVAHKELLRTLANSSDVKSSEMSISDFIMRDSFKSSFAGLLYAMSHVSDHIDRALLVDVFSFGVSSSMVNQFNAGPFFHLASLTEDSQYRISDYGAGVAGFGVQANIKHETKVYFSDTGELGTDSLPKGNMQNVLSDPSSHAANELWYGVYAIMMMTDPKFRSKLTGTEEISGLSEGYAFSQNVKDALMPNIRAINNCVGAQFFLYKKASREWLRYHISSLWDMTNFILPLLEFEDSKVYSSPFLPSVIANVKNYKTQVKDLFKSVFAEDLEEIADGQLPVIKFYDENNQEIESISDVIQEVIQRFRTNTYLPSYLAHLRHISKMMAVFEGQGLPYKTTNKVMHIKGAVLSGYQIATSRTISELGETLAIDPSLVLEMSLEDIRHYQNTAYRSLAKAGWTKFIAMEDLMKLVRNTYNINASRFSPEFLGSIGGFFSHQNAGWSGYTWEYLRMKIQSILSKSYKMEDFSDIREMVAVKGLSHASLSVLKLASSRHEGMVYGYQPEVRSVVTASTAYVMETIVNSIGLSVDAKIKGSDTTFLRMVSSYGEGGGALKLTRLGKSLLINKNVDGEKSYSLNALIEINPKVVSISSSRSQLSYFYLRSEQLLDLIYSDTFRVDMTEDYDVILLEDQALASFKSSAYDVASLGLNFEIELDFNDTITEATAKTAAMKFCNALEAIIFPAAKLTPSLKKKTDAEDQEEEEEKKD